MKQETSLKIETKPKENEIKQKKNHIYENEKTSDNDDTFIKISAVKTKKDLYNFFKISGRYEKYRNKNIASILNYQTIVNMKKLGYNEAVIGPADNDNILVKKIIGEMGRKITKKFLILEQKIDFEEEVLK